ncbi:hypothetical protein K3N28_04705 [Glycomyces sp. TRM65418]|uniref:hypothetical protein n=1 Tax=Glycomyces sp. TRM65418 TaxID=2867006 RepID=UPI001CE5363B|nr:hypothetical protein [Glycomyces sp. TRM65418]MCC3762367.1 hypothetical protein [Glycomyces sp. TRM65418]QZD56416.1 hypothetical protein K3N28_04670 [Glycomyces sp. TRM65418]
MTYPPAPQYPQQPPPSQGPKTRPGVVTAAVWTQFATAALLILTGLGMFSVQSAVSDAVLTELQRDPNYDTSGLTESDISNAVTVGFVFVAVAFVVFAAFYIVLGLLNNKAKRPARILSWILSGIALVCCGPYTLLSQIGTAMSVNSGDPYQDEMAQSLLDATPGWLNALSWAVAVALTLGSLLIIILLAVPASNEFFRKEETAMGPYTGQPPYGQPPYGQQPGQPGQAPPGEQPPGSEPPGPQPPQQ